MMLLLRNRKDKFRGSGECSSSGSSVCLSFLPLFSFARSPPAWAGRGLQPAVALMVGASPSCAQGGTLALPRGRLDNEGSLQSMSSPSLSHPGVVCGSHPQSPRNSCSPAAAPKPSMLGCALPRHERGSPRTRSRSKTMSMAACCFLLPARSSQTDVPRCCPEWPGWICSLPDPGCVSVWRGEGCRKTLELLLMLKGAPRKVERDFGKGPGVPGRTASD